MPIAPALPQKETRSKPSLDGVWNVILINDEVNLMPYVAHVLREVFGMAKENALQHMEEAHRTGRSIVWKGALERAEHYVMQLNRWHLQAELEQEEPS
jgi:ATP-dependent Clp protease adaptor protein ClpS